MSHITTIEKEDDWWDVSCECGWSGGDYPGADDACDAAGDHRVEQAIGELNEALNKSYLLITQLDAHRRQAQSYIGSLPLEMGEHWERRCSETDKRVAAFARLLEEHR